jgi:hypothetical protein
MSSKRALRRRECGRKRSYPTLHRALEAVAKYAQLYGEELGPYLCTLCNTWHIGHHQYPEHRTRRAQFP